MRFSDACGMPSLGDCVYILAVQIFVKCCEVARSLAGRRSVSPAPPAVAVKAVV